MFRRSKSPALAAPDSQPHTGKGRPTPTRAEAEAAARARAKAALDPKSARRGKAAGANRQTRQTSSRDLREGIKRGDQRYLGARDRGPVRRFIRDLVDARLNIAELTLPLLVSSLVASAAGLGQVGGGLLNATVLIVVLDSVWLRFKLRRELRRRFPDESLKGTTVYALTRSLQLRFMRIPKSQVKLGQALPEHY